MTTQEIDRLEQLAEQSHRENSELANVCRSIGCGVVKTVMRMGDRELAAKWLSEQMPDHRGEKQYGLYFQIWAVTDLKDSEWTGPELVPTLPEDERKAA